MLIIKNMIKKHDIHDFIFAKFFSGSEDVCSLVVKINAIDAYDLLNKKLIPNFGFLYQKPLTDFITTNEDKISSFKAKKLAKPFLTKFSIFCEEQENINKY